MRLGFTFWALVKTVLEELESKGIETEALVLAVIEVIREHLYTLSPKSVIAKAKKRLKDGAR